MQYLTRAAFALAVANVLLLLVLGQYDLRFGPVHLVAHGLFKPLQLVAAAFWISLAAISKNPMLRERLDGADPSPLKFSALILFSTLLVHASFISINFENPDWTHYDTSKTITSLHSMASLFINRQTDGFYRPLTFISLWFDYKWFGTYWPGYHIQSILIHLVNVWLICQLAIRLGLKARVAWMAAAFFGVAPVTFEAVLWPAARFDLLAAMFTLLSLLTALDLVKSEHARPWKRILLAVFVAAGLLNKESAYCLLPLLCFLLATRKLWGLESVKPSNALRCWAS